MPLEIEPEASSGTGKQAVEVTTLLLKLASRCNLDCSYCYIYHGADDSWESMPFRMPDDLVALLPHKIKKLSLQQDHPPNVVLHGGEPLLFGIRRLRDLVCALIAEVPDLPICVQTNGTVYNDEFESLLIDFRENMSLSISVDGPELENDRYRKDIIGRGSYSRIHETMVRAAKAGVLENLLLVVDVSNDPHVIYNFLRDSGARSANLILQDGDHTKLPPGKHAPADTVVGEWLWEMFKLYAREEPRVRVTIFDDIVKSMLRVQSGIKFPLVSHAAAVLTIDTDGELKATDTLRVNANAIDSMDRYNLRDRELLAAANALRFRDHIDATSTLSITCVDCEYLSHCGGGYLQHRYDGSSWENPSVYCSDYKYLFQRIGKSLCIATS